jgi:hypothetical protein
MIASVDPMVPPINTGALYQLGKPLLPAKVSPDNNTESPVLPTSGDEKPDLKPEPLFAGEVAIKRRE